MSTDSITKIPILDLSTQVYELWDEFNEAIQRVLKSGQFIMGPDVKAFEEEAAEYLGVKHAVGVNSGTDALVIGLRAMGVGPGDEVITTPFSFFATAESISNVGATPVFVDIDENTFNIDPSLIEAAITPRTKAIMPVHLYGNPAAMDEIMEIANKHGLQVIEDCAQSFGATYQGKQTGSIGHIGAFSFFPTKNLGAFGDGGLITTDNDEYAEQLRMLRAHGSKKKYHNEVLGYNSRLDSIQAAILRVKLPHIDKWNAARRAIANKYNTLLAEVPGVKPPEITGGHVFHQYTIRLTGVNRDEIRTCLAEDGIQTMIYYPIPQNELPIYEGQYNGFPVSDQVANEVLSLPIWPELPNSLQTNIVNELSRHLS